MKEAIEELYKKRKGVGINVAVKKEGIEAAFEDRKEGSDGTALLLNAMMQTTERFSTEIIQTGFGHGVKCKDKGERAPTLIEIPEIDTEPEESTESSEVSSKQESSQEEENDYVANYYEDSEFNDDESDRSHTNEM